MKMKEETTQLLIDTGGTFTDCIAQSPNGSIKKLKVLSSSNLRGKLIEKITNQEFKSSTNWGVRTNIFSQYRIRFLNTNITSTIESFNPQNNLFKLKEDSLTKIDINEEFEITAQEEAPVLAARLATETPLDQPLPAINLRLGTTKGTNALLERKGAKVTFIVTKGFKDLITIGSQQRPDLFALNVVKNPPLYFNVIEIDERINTKGDIIKSISSKELNSIIESLEKHQPETIAVALINSYKNDRHEQLIKKGIQDKGYQYISLSSEMAREIKFLPRAQTTIINAYLEKILFQYLDSIQSKISGSIFKVMTSYGGLVDAHLFQPKDSLLSGPAGGIVGAFDIGKTLGKNKLITFDMGGTSTDVSRIDHKFDYQFETEIDSIPVFSPVLSIETVAAGGGSICGFDGFKMTVGPESAGASPGPACYGAGGPLAITDVNLLLGRLDEESFGIPLNISAAEKTLETILAKMGEGHHKEDVLNGFLQIANEKMADAIRKISLRKGHDPSEFTLLAFGGAGGQNACALADLLSITSIIVPFDAGLLSAYGMGKADIERFAQKQLLQKLNEIESKLPDEFETLAFSAIQQLLKEGFTHDQCKIHLQFVYMRFYGQETSIEVPYNDATTLLKNFKSEYESLYGHWLENEKIEIESIKVIVKGVSSQNELSESASIAVNPKPIKYVKTFTTGEWKKTPVYQWENLEIGNSIQGPAILVSQNSTVFVDCEWLLEIKTGKNALLTNSNKNKKLTASNNELAELELFINRFASVAEDMGAILQRSSFSVNVKERLDFSCGVLDKHGYLIANAPHIPVHLGSLGICVRSVLEKINVKEGDVIITNHPKYGGSHLPDITLISGAFTDQGELIGYVANRAHHAEMGGKTPGSMPPDASCLEEEGVIISPTYLLKNGKENWAEIKQILTGAKYPTRSLDENIADLTGALASIKKGIQSLQFLADKFGLKTVQKYMDRLQTYSSQCIQRSFSSLPGNQWTATEKLDDGTIIQVQIIKENERITFDFSGTSLQHKGNLNATLAILTSAIIYVLRLMVEEKIPLNEGIIKNVKIIAKEGVFINPVFPDEYSDCPAVVGGNTETSQRIVDTLIKALQLAACSQGTMNNFIFGNDKFGFYETICGGTGAGNGFQGSDAVHQHMTNTKITDPEVIEFRYPVQLDKMEIRENSGGKGKWNGGNGVTREITFLEDINVSMLTQHRVEKPYGLNGGEPGEIGEQYILTKEGTKVTLKGIDGYQVKKGDKIIIHTPGGGGYGKA